MPLSVETVVKLSRAIDKWSGSIAVYGTKATDMIAWGVVDQIVHQNVRLNRESEGGAANPGQLTIAMDSVGEISVYHRDLFLGGLKQDRIVTHETNALRSQPIATYVTSFLTPIATQISLALRDENDSTNILKQVFHEWSNTLARVCIGLRRLGTGGALLITPSPISRRLDIAHPFPYQRLGDSAILRVLDRCHRTKVLEQVRKESTDTVSRQLFYDLEFADTDADDREDELTGAVKIVTPLAAIDGLVLMSPLLTVVGFGVKIRSASNIGKVYDGPEFVRCGTRATTIDLSHFGTRHSSMLRYCRADQNAIGLVISQDGQVRLIMSIGRTLTLWDNIKLLGHSENVRNYARQQQVGKKYRDQHRARTSHGYTSMPKTIDALMQIRNEPIGDK